MAGEMMEHDEAVSRDLHAMYAAFQQKEPESTLSFEEWLARQERIWAGLILV